VGAVIPGARLASGSLSGLLKFGAAGAGFVRARRTLAGLFSRLAGGFANRPLRKGKIANE
jgi:hypothetical protein